MQTALIKLLTGSVASSLGSASLNLSRLSSAATSIVTNAVNYEGNVALSVSGLPFGVNYTLTPGDDSRNWLEQPGDLGGIDREAGHLYRHCEDRRRRRRSVERADPDHQLARARRALCCRSNR